MNTTAIIACDHGYGHVRRCSMIASEMARRGQEVTLFAPVSSIVRFPFIDFTNVNIVDFETRTTTTGLEAGDHNTVKWHHRLPLMDKFELVVCDNLPEILEIRPDAILSGGFFWHQALSVMDARAKARAGELIQLYQPLVIASEMFASLEMTGSSKTELIGLYVSEGVIPFQGEDLLIASGGSAVMEEAFRLAVNKLANSNKKLPPPNVWIDPKLLPSCSPKWMKPAVFNRDLYRRILATVCRPGVGTLTDSFASGGRAFCAYETGNKEMIYNAQKVVQANYCLCFALHALNCCTRHLRALLVLCLAYIAPLHFASPKIPFFTRYINLGSASFYITDRCGSNAVPVSSG